MATTAAQLQFVQEVPTAVIGDTVPNSPAGSLILFADAGVWYAKDSAGVVTALSGVTNVTAADNSVGVTTTGTTRSLRTRNAAAGRVTAASKTYALSDNATFYERINGGAAMTDTLPTLAVGDNGFTIGVHNKGTTIAETVTFTSAGGEVIGDTATSYVLNYACRQTFIWTGTKWLFGAGNANLTKNPTPAPVAGDFATFTDATGRQLSNISLAATKTALLLTGTNSGDQTYTASGDATAPASASNLALTLATVNGTVGSFGSASSVATHTVNAKGLTTAAATVPILIAESQVTNLVTDLAAKQPTGNYITALTGDLVATGPGSVAGALATVNGNVGSFGSATQVGQFTVNAKGLITAAANVTINPLTGWIDVTRQGANAYLTSNTAAQNITAINAIHAAAPAGSTIYIPGGTYDNNAVWTMAAGKQFSYQGQGAGGTGGNTLLRWTANVAGDIITLPAGMWYWRFSDLNFCVASGVTQSAGALININGAAGTNFFNCTFSSVFGGFWNDVLVGTTPGAFPINQSWNTAIIQNCVISGYKGRGIFVDSASASLVIENSVIQGQWGGTGGTPAAAMALAGVEAQNCGALQFTACDILGNINNLLLDPSVGKVCASVFCANTYFDSSGGSCFKIAGAGATVRTIFTGCSFTTAGTNFTTAGTNLSAIEIGGSFAYGAGGQSTSFTDCNILNTFGTTGTSNGVTFTGTSADAYFTGCKVAGWANGYNLAASGTNITFPKILGGACGPSGGYGANTVGFNIAAGAYKGLVIQNVNAHGNGTNLTLGAVTVAAADASLFRITDNSGINPRGAVTTPAVGASTVAVTNTTGFRVTVHCRNGATSPTAYTVNGVVLTTFVSTAVSPTSNTFVLDPGGTIAFTYTVVPTWVWVGS